MKRVIRMDELELETLEDAVSHLTSFRPRGEYRRLLANKIAIGKDELEAIDTLLNHADKVIGSLPDKWMTGCDCSKEIKVGTYENSVGVLAPWGKIVTVDRCVLPDILTLWFDCGIPTIESCCGHNMDNGYIAVDGRYEQRMLDMGFKYSEGCYINSEGVATSHLYRRDLWAWPIHRAISASVPMYEHLVQSPQVDQ